MNKVILCGRLTRDPEVRYSSGENQTAVARYTLAVDRRFKRQGDEQTADFINCVVFGRGAEFAENYLHQGTKIIAEGRIQTGSYTNKDGQRVYTTDVVVENQEFARNLAFHHMRYQNMRRRNLEVLLVHIMVTPMAIKIFAKMSWQLITR